MKRQAPRAIFLLGTLLLVLEGAIGVYLFRVPSDGLAMRRIYTSVVNVADPRVFGDRASVGRRVPFREEDSAFLNVWIGPALAAGLDDVTRTIALRERVHHAVPIGEERATTANPVPAFREAVLRGTRPPDALCGTFARLLVAAARAAGFDARLLHLRPKTTGPGSQWLDPNTGHYTAEIFLPSERAWVLMDAFYNTHFRVNGRLAGALDLHQALRNRSSDGQVEVIQGPAQHRGMDAHVLLPYFAHLAVIGDAAFLSGPEMLLHGERLPIANWIDSGDTPLRPWDSFVLHFFLTLGVGLAVGTVLLVWIRWS